MTVHDTVQPKVSVILPTHNPHAERLRRTLEGLAAQTLPRWQWELLVIDNASYPPLRDDLAATTHPTKGRVVAEPNPGLTAARRRGVMEAKGELLVFVDDDNVLAPDYLAAVVEIFASDPRLGATGGASIGEFERQPEPWQHEFLGLLAIRDLGTEVLRAEHLFSKALKRNEYPTCAPIGAGMAVRKAALARWLEVLAAPNSGRPSDRKGAELTSGGDNDIVMCVLTGGWAVAYHPPLRLTHLIPASRLETGYLERLNRGIACSWVQVLALHDACPWPPIAPWTVRLRQAKAFITYRPWASPAHRIRWRGACGHFAGRALNHLAGR